MVNVVASGAVKVAELSRAFKLTVPASEAVTSLEATKACKFAVVASGKVKVPVALAARAGNNTVSPPIDASAAKFVRALKLAAVVAVTLISPDAEARSGK